MHFNEGPIFFLNSHRFELLEMGKSTFWKNSDIRPWPALLTHTHTHTRVTLQNNAGRAQYCISSCDVHVAARRVPGYRDCVAGHRPWTSFDVSRHATCVIFVPGPGVDIGKTTSRPFIPQWRLNTSERAAAFPRYCARGCPRETREREMDEESQVVAVVSISQTGFLSHDEKSWVFRDPFLRARCVTEIRNTKNLRSFGRGPNKHIYTYVRI